MLICCCFPAVDAYELYMYTLFNIQRCMHVLHLNVGLNVQMYLDVDKQHETRDTTHSEESTLLKALPDTRTHVLHYTVALHSECAYCGLDKQRQTPAFCSCARENILRYQIFLYYSCKVNQRIVRHI